MTRYIFTIGGVLSGLGKGITTASIGLLLKQKGFTVTAVKIDPYVSLDAGTMRPAEHGETFVTEDGGEIDQDLGNYERFLGTNLSKKNNITTGKVYQAVINHERAFKYQGRDAEIIPDVINEVKDQIYACAKGYDFCLVEIGGTTGDLENQPFLIAAREIGREHPAAYIMVTYLPYLRNVGELKTKPTQHAVAALRSVGIFPDIIVTRNEIPIDPPRIDSISKRCFIDEENIIDNPDTDCIYNIPVMFEKEQVAEKLLKKFRLKPRSADLSVWNHFVHNLTKPKDQVRIGLVGKYFRNGGTDHKDVYVSVNEAVQHAAGAIGVKPLIVPVNSEKLTSRNSTSVLKRLRLDGIIAPQGWGSRGTEGIIAGVRFARESKTPYLGLCFGMQMAVVEYARHVAGLKKAHSAEADKYSPHPVIHIMEDQKTYLEKNQYGGTIRLGAWPCVVKKGSLLWDCYQKHPEYPFDPGHPVMERHRHRYEFNNRYRKLLEDRGLVISGLSPDGELVEAVELPPSVHPFFIGTQFHPEYKSQVLTPHPLFVEFLRACTAISKRV